ncbi:26200_t:CDS:2, partial [Gigaspora margarita]
NKDWVLIGKIRDVVATRAFMLRIMKKEVPYSLQKISLRVDSKPEASVSSFSNSPGGQAPTSIGTKIREVYRVDLEIFKEVL